MSRTKKRQEKEQVNVYYRTRPFFAKVSGFILALAAFAGPMSTQLRAQCKESDFATNGVVAAPSRPTESGAPDPVQTGVVQVESGWSHSWVSNNTSQNIFSNLIKLGAWCNVELRWSANSYSSLSSSGASVHGFGDHFFTPQYRFIRETAHVPSVAMSYTVKFPTASQADGLGSGFTDHAVTLMAGKVTHGFSIISNASHFWIGQPGARYDGRYEGTLNITHALRGKLGFIGEVYGDSKLNAGNEAFASSTWGLSYSQSPRLVFDGGLYSGLTSGPGAPGKSAFFGMTYAIGDIYPRRQH